MKLFVIPNAIILVGVHAFVGCVHCLANVFSPVARTNREVDVVCFSRDTAETKNKLVTKFNISDNLADFLLEIGFGELNKYLNDAKFRKSEIAKWNMLREVIS